MFTICHSRDIFSCMSQVEVTNCKNIVYLQKQNITIEYTLCQLENI